MFGGVDAALIDYSNEKVEQNDDSRCYWMD